MKDLLASSRNSSPVRERAALSFSAMKSLVLWEKEENFMTEFGSNEKVVSLIKSLLDSGRCCALVILHTVILEYHLVSVFNYCNIM